MPLISEEINIATNSEISIGILANEIIAQINPNAEIVSDDIRIRPKNSEVERLVGSNVKIKRLTGWSPGVALQNGIAETIKWFREEKSFDGYKSHLYSV